MYTCYVFSLQKKKLVAILVHMLECVGWVYVHHWAGRQGKECRVRKGSWGGEGEGGKMMGNTSNATIFF